MSLTRKMLKAMGIEDDKIDQIIEAHTETTDALKRERDQYKADAETLPSVREELEKLKAKPGDGFKAKYEAEHEAFEAYKTEVETAKAKAEKEALYRAVLQEAGVDSKRMDSIIRVADIDGMEVKEGALADRDSILEAAKKEWADFIPQTSTKPATVQTPPPGSGGENEPHSLVEALRQKYK